MLYNDLIFDVSQMKDAVSEVLGDICESFDISSETRYNIKLVLNELIYNALRFTDCTKGVKVMAKVRDGKFSVAIKDFGCGFDHEMQLNKDIAEKNAAFDENGRGIYICSEICDGFRYNRKGNIIAIKLNLV